MADNWQDSFESVEYAALTKRFKDFRTVDWVQEAYKENKGYYKELIKSRIETPIENETISSTFSISQQNTDTVLIDDGSSTDYDESRGNSQMPTIDATLVDDDSAPILQNFNNFRHEVNKFKVIKSRLWITFQVWLALTLIGGSIGTIAGCLNIITEWLGDLKEGYCSTSFYLNKNFCCWEEKAEQCSNWVPWSQFALGRYLVYIIFSVLFGSISALLCKYYAPNAAGSGISEVKCIVSGFVTSGFLGWWTLFIKSIGLPLVIASGLNVGKEGPSVHYAACVGNVVAKLFHNFERSYMHHSQFLTAAAAAGVAVAFASPIGGVLFSIEEITSNFKLSTMWESYYCALVATGTLSAMNTFRTGQIVIFQVTYDTTWRYFEVPFFIALGIFGGIYGIVVSKFNIKCIAFRNRYIKNHPVKEVALLCLFTAVIGYFSEFIRLDMTEAMEILFHECRRKNNEIGGLFEHRICEAASSKGRLISTVISLLYATLLRMFLVVISYNSKIPCGIFVPSMAAGATFGKAVGLIAEALFNDSKCHSSDPGDQCIISGTYSFLGAAAALSGITNLTLAVVIIMFELTGALKYVIPTMIVVGVTKIVGDLFGLGMGGVADQMVRFNGIPYLDAKEDHDFDNFKLVDAMVKEVVSLPYKGLCFGDIELLIDQSKLSIFPIVDSLKGRAVLGMADRRSLLRGLKHYRREAVEREEEESVLSQKIVKFIDDDRVIELTGSEDITNYVGVSVEPTESMVDLCSCIRPEVFSVDIKTSLYRVMDNFIKLGPRAIIVEQQGKLVGIITKKDLARFELYLHYSKHGNPFLSSRDEVIFARIWDFLLKIDSWWKQIVRKRQTIDRDEADVSSELSVHVSQ
ncbi:hypothetical protein FOA43_001026 [Brettanomyces nanus]|uniref:Chloride channel protein n=1 Tax=Eeniella nana TaxID=13502 RepID=A0A875RYK6_EENNA|nr:uncharacterized protein FOA43_001026 [Brettanomyces nanus]QPG73713.1 hypothetical protein FOA43_001026 [Brettanomyces nanus]